MDSTLILHAGGIEVQAHELERIDTPTGTNTWHPVSHHSVLKTALDAIGDAGYLVTRSRLGVSKQGARMFGTIDLQSSLSDGVTLAVGIRNSWDKSFPMGFCAGSRVFVCDNLAFRSELMVKHKHTRNGRTRFSRSIFDCVARLPQFASEEGQRIACMQHNYLTDQAAESMLLRACYDKGIISQGNLAKVIQEYREPRHQEFAPRTAWSLLNAFTEIMRELQTKNPADLARRTMRLQGMLTQAS